MQVFVPLCWLVGWGLLVLAASPLGWWVWPLGVGVVLLAIGGLRPLLIFVLYGLRFLSKAGSKTA